MTLPFERIDLSVNGRAVSAHASPAQRLSSVLRDELGLRGTKGGCDAGDCGACTVLLDGEPVCACLVPAAQAKGREVRTVEGLANGRLSALQASFLVEMAAKLSGGKPPKKFTYRGVQPLFEGSEFSINANRTDGGMEMWIGNAEGQPTMKGTAVW